MRNKKVSIITPAYNSEDFISETIESVLDQDYENWEHLIVDDCSEDNTHQLIEDYSKQDPRIKVLKTKSNAGPALARNVALEQAEGRYVAFLDSDDIWLPQKLSTQLNFMVKNNYSFTFTSYRRFTGDKIGGEVPVLNQVSYKGLLKNTTIYTSSVIIDIDQTGMFRMKDVYYDDYVLWLEILNRGFQANGLNEDLLRYRIVEDSVSRNKINSAKEVWKIYRNTEDLNVGYSSWCFLNWGINNLIKYIKY